MKKRVVVTGAGIISSLGHDVRDFWNSIKEGKSGIGLVERIDVSNMSTKVAAEVKDFDPSVYMDKKEAKRMDRFTQFAVAASKLAIENSKLELEKIDKYRMGVIIGSGVGGIQTFEEQHEILRTKGPGRVSPFFVPMMISNMAAGVVAIHFGARGINGCVVSACASSGNAVADAFKAIQRGDADIILSGGAEAAITSMSFAGFCALKAMSTNEDPNKASRPFDLNRDGFVMGEGAAVLVLEELEHAINRGAQIIAEVVGAACTNDAYHITAPDPEAQSSSRCIKMAIDDAGIALHEVGYINAHGTSTDYNDRFETLAIKTVFKDLAKSLPVSSTKSMTGHLLGAAGALESIISCYALKEGFLPPTINYNTPDPSCDLDYVPNIGRNANIKYALSNSFGFGGHNVSLLFKKY